MTASSNDSPEEIVFAVRQPGKDGHWYANFSYYADDDQRRTFGDGGRLCRLNLRTGQITALLDDPRGGVRDPGRALRGGQDPVLVSARRGRSITICTRSAWTAAACGN